MLPKWHILLGLILVIILYLFIGINFLQAGIIFLASVLIDVDHYLWWIKRNKNFSIKEAYIWHKKLRETQNKPVMQIFHTYEFLLLILFLSIFWRVFFLIFIGILFHYMLDIISIEPNSREVFLTRYLISDKEKYL